MFAIESVRVVLKTLSWYVDVRETHAFTFTVTCESFVVPRHSGELPFNSELAETLRLAQIK